MITIKNINSYEVLDSRGNPTVCIEVKLSDGSVGKSIVPSGASVGKQEALELRDNDPLRYLGKGVLKACRNAKEIISNELLGMDATNQSSIDELLMQIDNTNNFKKIGANVSIGVSMAMARAVAISFNMPLYRYIGGMNAKLLPTPMLNIINGGSHANNNIDFQEYMIMPLGFECFSEALRAGVEIYHSLKNILNEEGFSTTVGDEGGFAPNLKNNEEPIEYILKAIERAKYKPGVDIFIGLDVAASEFYKDGIYKLKSEKKELDTNGMIQYYSNLLDKFPIASIEDGLSEDDWDGWKILTQKFGKKIQLVGDDLFVTNSEILKKGIKENIANAILIKPNQIGTLTQTMKTVRLARQNNYKTIISHRSGESCDDFIADLAIALNSGQIKTGAPARGERVSKYNRILEINNHNRSLIYYANTFLN